MKKIIYMIMALVLMISMNKVSFAAITVTESGKGSTHGVTATYNVSEKQIRYNVIIEWSDTIAFTYNSGSKGTWNPDTHTYFDSTTEGWEKSNVTIKVTNYSNTDITTKLKFDTDAGFESVGVSFTDSTGNEIGTDGLKILTADNGVDGETGTAVSATINVKPTGTLPSTADGGRIGTIMVTIE